MFLDLSLTLIIVLTCNVCCPAVLCPSWACSSFWDPVRKLWLGWRETCALHRKLQQQLTFIWARYIKRKFSKVFLDEYHINYSSLKVFYYFLGLYFFTHSIIFSFVIHWFIQSLIYSFIYSLKWERVYVYDLIRDCGENLKSVMKQSIKTDFMLKTGSTSNIDVTQNIPHADVSLYLLKTSG